MNIVDKIEYKVGTVYEFRDDVHVWNIAGTYSSVSAGDVIVIIDIKLKEHVKYRSTTKSIEHTLCTITFLHPGVGVFSAEVNCSNSHWMKHNLHEIS